MHNERRDVDPFDVAAEVGQPCVDARVRGIRGRASGGDEGHVSCGEIRCVRLVVGRCGADLAQHGVGVAFCRKVTERQDSDGLAVLDHWNPPQRALSHDADRSLWSVAGRSSATVEVAGSDAGVFVMASLMDCAMIVSFL